jgi:hypothetical protein
MPWYRAYYNLLFYRRDFRLHEDFHYQLPSGEDVMVPRGFIFDAASVPRVFWFILNPSGVLLIPGLLHDYAYRYRMLIKPDGAIAVKYSTRHEADRMFIDVCRVTNGMDGLDKILSAGLRAFGGIGWKRNRGMA